MPPSTRHHLLALVALTTIAATSASGCVPPMGVGAGPIKQQAGKGMVTGSTGLGVAKSRDQFQLEGSLNYQARSWVAFEGGLIYGTLRDRQKSREVLASSAMPYVRPTFFIDRFSLGVALSGLGAGGGGGGAAWGMVEPRFGYSHDDFSIYGAYLRHASTAVGSGTLETSATHHRGGGDYYIDLDGVRLALALEITRGDDSILVVPGEGSSEPGGRFEQKYWMTSFKLRVMSKQF